jgi:hypothetical protein
MSCPVNVNVFQQHGARIHCSRPALPTLAFPRFFVLWASTLSTLSTLATRVKCPRPHTFHSPALRVKKKRRCPGIGHTSFTDPSSRPHPGLSQPRYLCHHHASRLPHQSSPKRDVCRQAHLYSTTVSSLIIVLSPTQRHCSATMFVHVSSAEASTVYPLRSTHSPARLRRHPCQCQFVHPSRALKGNINGTSSLFRCSSSASSPMSSFSACLVFRTSVPVTSMRCGTIRLPWFHLRQFRQSELAVASSSCSGIASGPKVQHQPAHNV